METGLRGGFVVFFVSALFFTPGLPVWSLELRIKLCGVERNTSLNEPKKTRNQCLTIHVLVLTHLVMET